MNDKNLAVLTNIIGAVESGKGNTICERWS